MVSYIDQINVDNALQRFWELESYGSSPTLSTEEQECEHYFASTHLRIQDGRFMVHFVKMHHHWETQNHLPLNH